MAQVATSTDSWWVRPFWQLRQEWFAVLGDTCKVAPPLLKPALAPCMALLGFLGETVAIPRTGAALVTAEMAAKPSRFERSLRSFLEWPGDKPHVLPTADRSSPAPWDSPLLGPVFDILEVDADLRPIRDPDPMWAGLPRSVLEIEEQKRLIIDNLPGVGRRQLCGFVFLTMTGALSFALTIAGAKIPPVPPMQVIAVPKNLQLPLRRLQAPLPVEPKRGRPVRDREHYAAAMVAVQEMRAVARWLYGAGHEPIRPIAAIVEMVSGAKVSEGSVRHI
jgi:hypothetical protein